MNNKIKKYQIFSVIFSFVIGCLLHLTYKLSGENKFVAMFSSINESTWEHLKLLFFPMLVTAIIGCLYFKNDIPNFFCSKAKGIIASLIFMVAAFYTYNGIVGRNFPAVDISLFFISVLLGEFISYLLVKNRKKCNNRVAAFVLIVLFVCFIVFTFNTPKLRIFREP
ncbi:MAG: DUF6512 family protein [Clostridiales bacterium]|nr:DUF6512 family protein [Clostridiales bacterium]